MPAAPPLATVLGLWEASSGLPPVDRDLAFLAACLPEADATTLSAVGIGTRDTHLVELYTNLYGPRLDALLICGCGQVLEVNLDLAAVAAVAATTVAGGADRAEGDDGWVSIADGGYDVTARLPDSRDLAAAAAAAGRQNPALARTVLAERLLNARFGGTAVRVDELPGPVLERALAALAESDPCAEITVTTCCPACGSVHSAILDIGAHLWARVAADSRRGLRDVTALARAYRWPESEILSMSEHRRSAYLEFLA